MRPSPLRDLIVGLFVLAGLAAVAYLSLSVGGFTPFASSGRMRVFASFDEIGGLKPRAPVVVSGVKIGEVASIDLAPDYRARVTLEVDSGVELPIDTSASIVTSGVLGDRYVSLQLGGEEETIAPGGEITFVESAVILERMIGKLIHNAGVDGAAKDETRDGDKGAGSEE
jgi:phospholipid/cholesterol/gamma-HCH transport system substrate-binding protein